MSLLALEVEDLRCLSKTRLELHPHVNLITGANGAGKTSLLEAIYLLGRGRSFRTRLYRTADRARSASRSRCLAGRTTRTYPTRGLGVRSRRRACGPASPAGTPQSLAELSQAFPVQVIDPGIHRLVEEGPAYRRRWLDWAVFHVEPSFVSTLAANTPGRSSSAMPR